MTQNFDMFFPNSIVVESKNPKEEICIRIADKANSLGLLGWKVKEIMTYKHIGFSLDTRITLVCEKILIIERIALWLNKLLG